MSTSQRPPRNRPDPSLLAQVLASQAAMAAQLEAMGETVKATQLDAREARDGANRLATILSEQDIVKRLTEHRNDTRQMIEGLRQDVVVANNNVKRDVDDLEKRVDRLEKERDQRDGATTLIGWLMKNAPWLVVGLGAFLAGLGFKLPGK